jgi:hypothetical protein
MADSEALLSACRRRGLPKPTKSAGRAAGGCSQLAVGMFWLYGSEEKVLVKARSSPRATLNKLHLTVWKRTDGSVPVDIFIDTTGV